MASPSSPLVFSRSAPLLIPTRGSPSHLASFSGAPSARLVSEDYHYCSHQLAKDCRLCRVELMEARIHLIRTHASLILLLGQRMDHSRYNSCNLHTLSLDELCSANADLALQSNTLRSYITNTSPTCTEEAILTPEFEKPPSLLTSCSSASKVNKMQLLTSKTVSQRALASSSNAMVWFLSRLGCALLESLVESVYLRVWGSCADPDEIDSSTVTFSHMRRWRRSPDQEMRWKQVEALLISFERGRSEVSKDTHLIHKVVIIGSHRDSRRLFDELSMVSAWNKKHKLLHSIIPPSATYLKNAVHQYGNALPAQWPDLCDAEDAISHLASCESRQFLECFCRCLYLFDSVYLLFTRIIAGEMPLAVNLEWA